jgi:hypothetical protein
MLLFCNCAPLTRAKSFGIVIFVSYNYLHESERGEAFDGQYKDV